VTHFQGDVTPAPAKAVRLNGSQWRVFRDDRHGRF
jgi:hypothetical protein